MPTDETVLALDDDLDDDVEDNPAEFAAARKDLQERCQSSNVPASEVPDGIGGTYITIQLPAGREKRPH